MAKTKTPRPDPASFGLPPGGVDSHAHLDMDRAFADDLDEALVRAAAAGVTGVGNVFLGPSAYAAGKDAFERHPGVFFLLGVHPNDADACTSEALSAMGEAFASDARLRAVGEIGLDFYWDRVPPDVQRRAFTAQLAMARRLGVPVVIHSRDAFDATLDVLDAEGFAGQPVLWHCFGGDASQARAVLDRGWHLSVPGPVTYKKNEDLRAAVRFIGLERLLLETDCPFLSPEPYRGTRNEPAYLVFTAQAVAQTLAVPVEEVWKRTGDNARAFFGLTADAEDAPGG